MKVLALFLSFLFLIFSSSLVYGFKPNEKNCRPEEKDKAILKRMKRACEESGGRWDDNICEGATRTKKIKKSPEGGEKEEIKETITENILTSEFRPEAEKYVQQECDNWEEEQQRIEDKEEELAEAQKQEEKDFLEQQQDAKKEAKVLCDQSYRDYQSEKRSIESRVMKLEREQDELNDRINKIHSGISDAEDQIKEQIENHKDLWSQRLNQLKAERVNEDSRFREEINRIKDGIDLHYRAIEDVQENRQNLYDERYKEYLSIYSACWETSLEEVNKQRAERLKKVKEGNGTFKVGKKISLYASGPKVIERYYQQVFKNKTQECYLARTGRSSLTAFRSKSLINTKSTHPKVIEIETRTKEALRKLDRQEELAKERIGHLEEELIEIQKIHKNRDQDLKKQIQSRRKAFEARLNSLNNDYKKVREKAAIDLLNIKNRLYRIQAEDPKRTLKEKMQATFVSCCSTPQAAPTDLNAVLLLMNNSRCKEMRNYTSNLTEQQHINVTPPASSRRGGIR